MEKHRTKHYIVVVQHKEILATYLGLESHSVLKEKIAVFQN